ncbi:MAG: peptidoglycan DD-metalloendopeptidase family protein [Nanoarchaeota archaeon]|nr:peptidoglycan DD-metalloendopeptidase family protein [Nanoarchaeota archaeon]
MGDTNLLEETDGTPEESIKTSASSREPVKIIHIFTSTKPSQKTQGGDGLGKLAASVLFIDTLSKNSRKTRLRKNQEHITQTALANTYADPSAEPEFSENPLEKELKELNKSERIFGINSIPELIMTYLDNKNKIETNLKEYQEKRQPISSNLERQIAELEESFRMKINNMAGTTYFSAVKSAMNQKRTDGSLNENTNNVNIELNNKFSVYYAANQLMEAKTERTGFLKRTIPENNIRSEITALSKLLYETSTNNNTKEKTEIDTSLKKLYSSNAKCKLNNNEKIAIELILKEIVSTTSNQSDFNKSDNDKSDTDITASLEALAKGTHFYRQGTLEKAAEYISESYEILTERYHENRQNVETRYTEIYTGIADKIKNAISATKNKITDKKTSLTDGKNRITNSAAEKIQYAKALVLTEIPGQISTYASKKSDQVKQAATKTKTYIKTYFSNIAKTINNARSIQIIKTPYRTIENAINDYERANEKNNSGNAETASETELQNDHSELKTYFSRVKINLPSMPDLEPLKYGLKKAGRGMLTTALLCAFGFGVFKGGTYVRNNYVKHTSQQEDLQQRLEEKNDEGLSKKLNSSQSIEMNKKTILQKDESERAGNIRIAGTRGNKEYLASESRSEFIDLEMEYLDARDHKIEDYSKYPLENWSSNVTGMMGKQPDPHRPGECKRTDYLGKNPKDCMVDHKGIDIKGKNGDVVSSVESGIVIAAKNIKGRGETVIILHENGYTTIYSHGKKDSYVVKEGEKVMRGQDLIGMEKSDNPKIGYLHYEIRDPQGRPVNPFKALKIMAGPPTYESYLRDNAMTTVPDWLTENEFVSKKAVFEAEKYIKNLIKFKKEETQKYEHFFDHVKN